ncbi:zinc metallopeptidase [Pradoshia sp. D12]|uniref:zinc metallopeptidase n=1 Tax=Bacillaceae TaxID=186817 RepID=UPI00080AD713|nr:MULTISPECIES: zinc metallopeptidase [Bacillaceae]OCA83553.1 Zn-dependent protease [Bacillus sp. FJAT-27986]QFK71793.1 zinc metallopeptidase [Pradoshia sp. D12]TPF73588.1 zinc metallopeptidase [Bacillus sp. D12]
MSFLIYFILLLIIPIYAQMKVQRAYKKYSQVPASNGYTGAEVARKLLDENGLYNIRVEETHGVLSDHYDPTNKVVRLSSSNYHGHSLAGTAVAAHEVGHAIQDKEDYSFMRIRHKLVPVANIGSNFSWILILAGLLLGSLNLAWLGVLFMGAAVLFQFVTLPVEFNASNRAMKQVVALGVIRADEEKETKKVLDAAALTYVAAAAVAVLELLRFVFMLTGMNGED